MENIINDMCGKCLKITNNGICSVYPNPSYWEDRGGCPMKTDVFIEVKGGKKLNPIKSSKRGSG